MSLSISPPLELVGLGKSPKGESQGLSQRIWASLETRKVAHLTIMATGTTDPEEGQRGCRALSAHGDGSSGLGGHSSEDIDHGAPESSSQPQGHCAPSSQRKTPSSQSVPPEMCGAFPSWQCLKFLLRYTDP